MNFAKQIITALFLICGASLASVFASDSGKPDSLQTALVQEIEKNYSGARIQLNSDVRWVRGGKSWEGEALKFIGEDGRGNAHFSLQNSAGYFVAEGWVAFSAWVEARTAQRRVHPGDLLIPSGFSTRQVDVASGQSHDYRGVILPAAADLAGLEAIQTILEGQLLVSSAVRRVPDVRRGDAIRVLLKSNDLALSLPGIAQEPSYLNRQVKVMTVRTKRELMGQLMPNGVVEVKL